MKLKSIIINTLLSTFLIISLTGCNSSLSEKNGNISGNPDGSEKKQTQTKQEPDNPSEASKTVPSTKVKNEEVIQSGETTYVPWENDSEFIESIKKNNTPVLMAAYRTVLKDPLPGEEENVHLGASMLKGKVLMPGEVFSQNKTIGPYTTERGFKRGPTYIGSTLTTTIGGGVCKIASTLYNTTVLSNLKIEERYAHGMPVPYVPYGQDATVSYGSRDFKFRNTEEFPITIWAQGVDNVLYIGFYGQKKPPKVSWHHEVIEVYKAPKIYKANSKLPSGTEKLVLEGMDGGVVKSWITIENSTGVTTKQMGNSNYKPMPYIIEKGS